jgi:hypothetical protein
MRPTTVLFLLSLLLAACDPCSDYCALECECAGAADSCAETCLTTMDLYTGSDRADECTERYTALEETCR